MLLFVVSYLIIVDFFLLRDLSRPELLLPICLLDVLIFSTISLSISNSSGTVRFALARLLSSLSRLSFNVFQNSGLASVSKWPLSSLVQNFSVSLWLNSSIASLFENKLIYILLKTKYL